MSALAVKWEARLKAEGLAPIRPLTQSSARDGLRCVSLHCLPSSVVAEVAMASHWEYLGDVAAQLPSNWAGKRFIEAWVQLGNAQRAMRECRISRAAKRRYLRAFYKRAGMAYGGGG